MEKKFNAARYFWQIIYAHTIAYFIAGIFAAVVINYRELYSTEAISSLMLPVDTPIVALGPFLQIFRGIIIALILLPLRKTFFEEKHGLLKLGLLITGLSLLSTIGPTFGSFDGYIYTKIPYMYQILGYPEAIVYVLLFIGILGISIKFSHKKIVTILSIVITALICFLSIMGYVTAQNGGSREPLTNHMSSNERESVVFGPVSDKQKYYKEVADVAEYIQEMSVYDEELDSTYIIHITLPPNYDKNKSYPMYLMTDGIWRLSDHAELRPLMVNGEIEDIILVSIGYNYGIDAENLKIRSVELMQKSDLFLDFITDNLVPYLGELYNIDYNRSALMGHSLGGLFMYYAVFNYDKYKNDPFHYYVMASPSFYLMDNPANWKFGDIEKDYFNRNKKLKKEIYLTAGDKETGDMPQNNNNFLNRSKKYGIKTIDYEIYDGGHSSYVKPMMRKSLLKFYKKDK